LWCAGRSNCASSALPRGGENYAALSIAADSVSINMFALTTVYTSVVNSSEAPQLVSRNETIATVGASGAATGMGGRCAWN